METEKLYYADPYLTAFTATVLGCEAGKGGYLVTLDRTAFYPEGGGQPADHGTLGGAAVTDVHEKDGVIDVTADAELALLCVCNRHGRGGKTIVPIRGTGLRAGAFATTVSHDCHNLLIVYRSEADAWLAAQTLECLGGGFAAVLDGKVLGTLALPVGGLMSPLDGRTLADEISAFERASAEILPSGRPGDNLLRFATSALPVLPGFVVTDKGVVDGRKQCFVPVFRKLRYR